ncbi:hypothetical protein CLOP_g23270 [Closterium sp. NIES-67]|nr:hypothetical protein CLOP_g23270 [Closterium sp. NIES-67]
MASIPGGSRAAAHATAARAIPVFLEASPATQALLPPHPPDPPHPPRAEASDDEAQCAGARDKDHSARSARTAQAPPLGAQVACAAAAHCGGISPAFPQRDAPWAAALAACIALLLVHELASPLFALQRPSLAALAFFLPCALSALLLSLPPPASPSADSTET